MDLLKDQRETSDSVRKKNEEFHKKMQDKFDQELNKKKDELQIIAEAADDQKKEIDQLTAKNIALEKRLLYIQTNWDKLLYQYMLEYLLDNSFYFRLFT